MIDIRAALTDLLDHELPLDDALDRHFSADHHQRTNGTCSDRGEFAAHTAHPRSIVSNVRITVLDEHRRCALRRPTRGRGHHTRTDGGRVVREVCLFGEVAADGRSTRVEETTPKLTGEEVAATSATPADRARTCSSSAFSRFGGDLRPLPCRSWPGSSALRTTGRPRHPAALVRLKMRSSPRIDVRPQPQRAKLRRQLLNGRTRSARICRA